MSAETGGVPRRRTPYITLPRLCGTREHGRLKGLSGFDLETVADPSGELVIDGRLCVSAAPGYLDELVAVVKEHAGSVALLDVTPSIAAQLISSAEARRVPIRTMR